MVKTVLGLRCGLGRRRRPLPGGGREGKKIDGDKIIAILSTDMKREGKQDTAVVTL